MLRDRIATLLTPSAAPAGQVPAEPGLPPVVAAPEPAATSVISTPVLLPRHGARPLAFQGCLLFSAGNRGAAPRWHEIAIYERAEGGFVAAVRQGARLDGLPEFAWAEICPGPEEVLGFLLAHDPVRRLPLDAFGSAPLDPAAATALLQDAAAERAVWQGLLLTVFGARAAPPSPHEPTTGASP